MISGAHAIIYSTDADADRAFLKDILESRKNLRDRFNFEAADMNTPSSASR